VVYLCISLAIGSLLPGVLPKAWPLRSGWWIAVQGTAAWVFALVVLGMVNLTPLCLGQDNGDGSNDLSLCVIQTALVGFFYSFPQAVLLALSAIPGGMLIKKTNHLP
jgi:hypothetical protein